MARYLSRIVFLCALATACGDVRESDLDSERLRNESLQKSVESERVELLYQYCNLDESSDRRDAIENRFALAGIKPQRVRGIPGKELAIDTLVKANLYDKIAFSTLRGREARPGEIGYHLLFLNYLAEAARSKDKLIVRFDDDAVFEPTLDDDLRNLLKVVPRKWDVLFLGCNRDRMVGVNGHIFGFPGYTPIKGGDYNLCPSDAMKQVGNTSWYKLDDRCIAGSYAIIVHPKKAQELLPYLLTMTAESDMALKENFSKMDVYCAHPPLVDVAPVVSTIKPPPS